MLRCLTLSPGANYTPAFAAAANPNGWVAPFLPATDGNVSLPSIKKSQLFGNSEKFVNGNEQWGVSGELTWNFGETEFTAIVSYRDFHAESIQDDFQGVQVYSVAGVTEDNLPPTFDDIKTFTAEARLQGTAMNDRLDWLIGAYYADEKIVEEASLTLGPDFQAFVGQANFGGVLGPLAPAYLGLVAQAGAFLAGGATDPSIFATPISADNSFGLNHYEQDGQSFSVFTHNIFSVTDTLKLTLGARYVDDTKDGSYDQLDANNPACLAGLALAGADPATAFAALQPILGGDPELGDLVPQLLTTPALNGPAAFINCFPFAAPALGVSFLPKEYDLTFKDDEFIYTGQLAWEPTPDLLAYAGFTHGYKAGGFNLDSTSAASGADPRFRSEEIDSYEVGLKATVLDGRGRANFAFFYNELADFQVLEFTGTQFQTFNVDDVTAKGFEAELFAQWTPYINNSLAVTYTDAKYGENCDASFIEAGLPNPALELCGTSLTNAPKLVTVFGTTYQGPISSGIDWTLLANLNVRYETSRRTSTKGLASLGGVITGPVAFDVQDANVKVNARIGFTSPDEAITIEFWGRNIFNEITRGITFNTPLAGSSNGTAPGVPPVVGRSAFIDDPRTYGVTVRTKF